MCTRGAQHAHTSSSESRHRLQAGSLLLGLSPPVEQKARRAAASTRHRREPRAPGRSTDAVSFPGVPSHACISGRMLFLSACLCWLVHTTGGEGIDRVQGWAGGAARALANNGLGLVAVTPTADSNHILPCLSYQL